MPVTGMLQRASHTQQLLHSQSLASRWLLSQQQTKGLLQGGDQHSNRADTQHIVWWTEHCIQHWSV